MASKLKTIEDITKAAEKMREVYHKSRCPCGCGGTWNKTVGGTIGGKSAIWMGCCYRNGSAVGGGLTEIDYHVACAVLEACRKLKIDPDEIM